jgi:arylformamidase
MNPIDISRTLHPGIAVWPGDAHFHLGRNVTIAGGAAVNLSTLNLSAHTGAHADAPYHFDDAGVTIEYAHLDIYWGLAQVVSVSKTAGPLFASDFAHADLRRAPRLLVHSAASHADPTTFHRDFVYPSPELADYLGKMGVILYGADAPSMDEADSKTLPGHHALKRNHIAILEGLDLSQAPDGVYELVALPLKIGNGDGSPVRAALRPLHPKAHASAAVSLSPDVHHP